MCSLHDEQPNALPADMPASSNIRLLAYLRTRLQSAIGPTITIGCDTMRLAVEALEEQDTSHPIGASGWPEAVSDGLTLACFDCGQVPMFDYRVDIKFWRKHVPGPERTGVICLPCLDLRCGGAGLAEAIIEVQWTGTKHTVVLRPTLRHVYEAPTERPMPSDSFGGAFIGLQRGTVDDRPASPTFQETA